MRVGREAARTGRAGLGGRLTAAPLLDRLGALTRARLAPPPKLTVSEWADRYRMLSRESSAEPGRWMTARAPYQRGIMDAFADPLVEQVVVMSSAQVGKTEAILNVAGFYMDQDPSPILVVQPTISEAEQWSKTRLAPMLRDSPRLRVAVKDARSRDSGNTLLVKEFAGGHITIVGANAPAGLAAKPIRVVLCDEVDRYPASAGTEGDPIQLAFKRTSTFWNRKLLLTSTPTIKGLSRIEAAYRESDQRRFWVPCPDCGAFQVLTWGNLKYSALPEPAYACAGCGVLIEESRKAEMLAAGEWRAEEPGRRTAGFAINALYSPWARWADLVREWEAAQGEMTRLQVFVNTVLGEPWEEGRGYLEPGSLEARAEVYGARLPHPVRVVTMGVDVQDDRLEATTVGYGPGEEQWVLAHDVILGDPEGPVVWQDLEALRTREWRKADGSVLRVDTCCVDSGAHTEAVYRYVKPRYGRRVYATKGYSEPGRPLVSAKPTTNNKARVRLFMIGTDTAKDLLAARLKVALVGPQHVHFPVGLPPDYYDQLTSEKPVRKHVAGRWIRRWELDKRARGRDGRPIRNEALDCFVLAYVALVLSRVRPERLVVKAPPPLEPAEPATEPAESGAELTETAPIPTEPRPNPLVQAAIQKALGRRPKGGWVGGWRR